ncbi:DUF805 domain-containing protein [Akkermansia muciniphila]|uniref:DUF805 domain-containing protein n=1 Tax=Akkermansia muciniphila TaxID=239935 RepID=UPI0031C969D0|nr:DUF805 domain-containing protein [Akkermansia muciniphila]
MEFIHPGFPSPSVTCRHLHDTNKSGMSLPLSLIILIRGIFLFIYYCEDSQHGTNQSGAS